jgi:hypothetical protein
MDADACMNADKRRFSFYLRYLRLSASYLKQFHE